MSYTCPEKGCDKELTKEWSFHAGDHLACPTHGFIVNVDEDEDAVEVDRQLALQRLLEYPLQLIVRRADVARAARAAGVPEPPEPLSHPDAKPLLDQELWRQHTVLKQHIQDYIDGKSSLYTLAAAAGVPTQDWMKGRLPR